MKTYTSNAQATYENNLVNKKSYIKRRILQ